MYIPVTSLEHCPTARFSSETKWTSEKWVIWWKYANYIYDMVLNVFHRQKWKVFDKNRLNCIWFWMKYSSRQSIVELVFVCLTRALRVCNLIFVIYVYKSSPKAILFSTFSFSHRAHTHKNSSSENLIYKIIQSISGNGNNENKQNCCTQRFWPGF